MSHKLLEDLWKLTQGNEYTPEEKLAAISLRLSSHYDGDQPRTMEEQQKEILLNCLLANDWDIKKVASSLAMGKSTIYRDIKADPEYFKKP